MISCFSRENRLAACLLFALAAASTAARAEDWPQFRGANCSGLSAATAALPTTFSDKDHVKWSARLGDGIGSPAIAAGRVFVTQMLAPDQFALTALDAHTGAKLWQRTWGTGELPPIHATNSYASTTPAADAQHVYFYSSWLGLRCLDAASGADVWQAKVPTPYFVFKWGPGMSPVLYQDLVIFCQDDDLSPALYAFDRATGKLRWKDDRSDMCCSYSHPVINQTKHGDELVVAGTGMLIGYDLQTGQRTWFARSLLRNIKTTPVCRDGIIYISLQSGGIANQWIASIDQATTGNRDGKVTKAELQAFVGKLPVPELFFKKTFERGDANGDGALEGAELDKAFLPPGNEAGAEYGAASAAEEFVLAVRGGGRGDVTDTHVLWKHPTKHTDHIVSPLVSGGRMLLVKCGGIATCFELEGGKKLWGPKRIDNASDYFASPVCGDGKIYIAGENGFVVVLKDSPTLEVLAKNDMGASIVATPAIADGRLYIRTREALVCVGR
ncbi:MAG TPA: PQQ-binding-like beta-propeller repeat protein [Pirellulales bacterium]|jgi:outer membrane protein assembly factor BamB|nr:PQQ-binding-like beta-propeller repeat protein [Pirellulales bacterium]